MWGGHWHRCRPAAGAVPAPSEGRCSCSQWRAQSLFPVEGAVPVPSGGRGPGSEWRARFLFPVEGAVPVPSGGRGSCSQWGRVRVGKISKRAGPFALSAEGER
jgi:hypothetical protein